LKDKIDEMFVEYWEKLLSEDVKSINEYLQSID